MRGFGSTGSGMAVFWRDGRRLTVREHGTYQNMKLDVTVGGEPFTAEMKGGVEIKGATVEYRRKGAR